MTPDEIVEAHAHLTLADVHAALSYSYDHMEAGSSAKRGLFGGALASLTPIFRQPAFGVTE
jgi:hypothetical protein